MSGFSFINRRHLSANTASLPSVITLNIWSCILCRVPLLSSNCCCSSRPIYCQSVYEICFLGWRLCIQSDILLCVFSAVWPALECLRRNVWAIWHLFIKRRMLAHYLGFESDQSTNTGGKLKKVKKNPIFCFLLEMKQQLWDTHGELSFIFYMFQISQQLLDTVWVNLIHSGSPENEWLTFPSVPLLLLSMIYLQIAT